MRDALSLLDQCGVMAKRITAATVREVLGIVGREALRELVAAVGRQDVPSALAQLSSLLEQGKDVRQILTELEEYLRTTERAVLMVTHDRYFLDNVCSSIYELARKRIKLYTGNYSQYLEKKATEAEIEANTEKRIESVLRTEREWLLRGPQPQISS